MILFCKTISKQASTEIQGVGQSRLRRNFHCSAALYTTDSGELALLGSAALYTTDSGELALLGYAAGEVNYMP